MKVNTKGNFSITDVFKLFLHPVLKSPISFQLSEYYNQRIPEAQGCDAQQRLGTPIRASRTPSPFASLHLSKLSPGPWYPQSGAPESTPPPVTGQAPHSHPPPSPRNPPLHAGRELWGNVSRDHASPQEGSTIFSTHKTRASHSTSRASSAHQPSPSSVPQPVSCKLPTVPFVTRKHLTTAAPPRGSSLYVGSDVWKSVLEFPTKERGLSHIQCWFFILNIHAPILLRGMIFFSK